MKFSRLVALVVALVVVEFGVSEWIGPNTAQSQCTQACGPATGSCIGTNTNTCLWCSNGSSGACNGSIVQWFNNVTNGTAMGSSNITLYQLNCRNVWPCSYITTVMGKWCDRGGCNCANPRLDCFVCKVGSGTTFQYTQCYDNGCRE